ncbi:MAG: 2-isopropylmalate synthase [Chitinivibrionales bacterium]
MARKVYIFDTTLRDGEQALQSSLTYDQKLRIAHQLATLNVDIIEAGFPVSSPGDFKAVNTIAKEVEGPVICGLARMVKADIDRCAEAVSPAERGRIHVFIGTSPLHMEKKLGKTPEQVLETITKNVKYARGLCEDVQFSAEDAGRTEPDFLCRSVETAIDAGASTVNIPDTVGYTTPSDFAEIIDDLVNRVPSIDKAVIAVHCHNDLGMATANSITAVKHGARQVECAVNGIGERAGNAALEEVVMAMKTRKKYLGVTNGVKAKNIMRTSRMVQDICNMPVQPNKAVVGENAFAHSSGIHQDGVLKAKNTYEIMTPKSVGLKDAHMNLTSRSGSHVVKNRLKSLGYEEDQYDIHDFYEKFIELADKKGRVYDDDLITLMESGTSYGFEEIYSLEYLCVNCGKGVVPSATTIVRYKGKDTKGTAVGDGAVDAAVNAIDKASGKRMNIQRFSVDSITEGRDALGKVKIVAKTKRGVFTGTGSSTDIIEASAFAYMDVINKDARMKYFGKKTA